MQCCIVAFLMLTESKLKNWTVKYGREERVQQLMNQYRAFVSKNKIFQEFQKAFVEFKEVCEEYRRDGDMAAGEWEEIERFTEDVDQRWKSVSTELRCVQSLLEEVLAYWKRWNANYEPLQQYIVQAFEVLKKDDDEAAQEEFFGDVSSWKERYGQLQDTVAFLVATSDAAVGQDLREKFELLSSNWEQLFGYVEKYMHAGDVNRSKRDYQEGLDKLDQWLRKSEDLLSTSQQVESDNIKETLEKLVELHGEVGGMEEVFKSISKKFQELVPELDQEEVENMMFVLKKEKENLVIIRSMIPTKIQLFHHLLSQLEAIDEGEKEILSWCDEVDRVVASAKRGGTQDEMRTEYDRHKPFLSKTINMQALVQSKNNVFQSVLNNTEGKEGIDNGNIVRRMNAVNDKFEEKLATIRELDQSMLGGIKAWDVFLEAEKAIVTWIQEAEAMISVKHIESKDNVESHKTFFGRNNDHLIDDYAQTAEALKPYISEADKANLEEQVRKVKEKWDEIQAFAPLHMMKVEFRLDEEAMAKYVKEVERQIQEENIAFQKSENVARIIQAHIDYFDKTDIVNKVEGCLERMGAVATSYSEKVPGDSSLGDTHKSRRKQWDEILGRVKSIFGQLEQIPEQWREYERKFSEMVRWMDSVDESLARMFKVISTVDDFEKEKEAFQVERAAGTRQRQLLFYYQKIPLMLLQQLCRDVDSRREDMKWLVQKLDQLVSHRADDSGLSEQKRLEGLITRYKSMIPVIEVTMQKIDVYSRSYAFREEAAKVDSFYCAKFW